MCLAVLPVVFGCSDSFAHPCCRTSLYCRTLVPPLVSLWNYLNDPVFDAVGLAGSKSEQMPSCWPNLLSF